MGFIILLLLPALGSASITINIRAASTNNQSFATNFGKDFSVIADQELAAFNITDSFLKKAAGLYSGSTPLDVFVKSPTPWGDLYKSYHWAEVKRETKVKNIKIFSFDTREVTLAYEKFTNSGSRDALFTSRIKEVNVENEIIKTFTGAKMAVDVKYNVDLIVKDHPALHIKFESSFGNDTIVNDSKKLEAREVNLPLKTNQSAEIVINATMVTLGVVVNYETSLSGYVAVNYNPRYNGHHFWAYDVKELMKAGGMPVVKTEADLITIRYYSNANIIAIDSQSGNTIVSEEAQYADYVTVQRI